MEKNIDFTSIKPAQAVTDPQGEAKEGYTRVEIDKVAEGILDKYESAFLELAK